MIIKERIKNKKKLKDPEKSLKKITWPIKIFSVIGVVWGIIFLILTGFYFVSAIDSVINNSTEEILNDNSTIRYISNVNGYSIDEAKEVISENERTENIVFGVVLPTIVITLVVILIIISCKKSYDIVVDVKSNKDLFTEKKLDMLKKLKVVILDICLVLFLSLRFKYLIYYIFIEFIFEILIYLFTNCVEKEK